MVFTINSETISFNSFIKISGNTNVTRNNSTNSTYRPFTCRAGGWLSGPWLVVWVSWACYVIAQILAILTFIAQMLSLVVILILAQIALISTIIANCSNIGFK